ncbi:MAG: 50S ribosomal protein L13 [Candidatus Hodarchaeales archaeon]
MDKAKLENAKIINVENSVLGRLASIVAKRLLAGEEIVVVNAQKSIISGSAETNASKYRQRFHIKTKSNPLKGPFYPREPDQILRRTVRGMLPYKKSRGKTAYSRLLVFKDYPEELKEKECETIPESLRLNKRSKYITLGDLRAKI